MALKCLCKFPATIMSCSKYRVSFDKKFRPNHLTANLLTKTSGSFNHSSQLEDGAKKVRRDLPNWRWQLARYFSENEIDEFRDCFFLNTHSNAFITSETELSLIMRSLQMSPTLGELKSYFNQKGGKLSFADFLDVMHTHSNKEKLPDEILNAFKAHDVNRTGKIHIKDLRHILRGWGERLDEKQVERLFREANIVSEYVRYEDLIKILCAPLPDY